MNETTGHTPGPWHTTAQGYIGSDHSGYVPIRTPFREDAFRDDSRLAANVSEDELQANARLIAAAPEMLAALERVLPTLIEVNESWSDGEDDYAQTLEAARAAIAKATGGAL